MASSQDIYIVENYYNSETVEQKAMFTLFQSDSKTHVHTLRQSDEASKKNIVKSSQSVNMSFTQHFIKCVHEFYSTLCKVCT
jgi:hypothetical protein